VSEHPLGSTDLFAPPLPLHLDQVCDRFEEDCKKAGAASPLPRVEDYLGETPEPERRALILELIALEVAYRRRRGESLQLAEYQQRFPALDARALNHAIGASPAPPRERLAGRRTIFDTLLDLGGPTALFKHSPRYMAAGFVVGLLLIGAGLVCLGWFLPGNFREPGPSQAGDVGWLLGSDLLDPPRIFWVGFGLLSLGGGVAVLLRTVRLCRQRVWICPRGFVCLCRGRVETFPWDQIAGVEQQSVGLVSGNLRWKYTIRLREGAEFAFDDHTVGSSTELARMIQERVLPRGVPWEVRD